MTPLFWWRLEASPSDCLPLALLTIPHAPWRALQYFNTRGLTAHLKARCAGAWKVSSPRRRRPPSSWTLRAELILGWTNFGTEPAQDPARIISDVICIRPPGETKKQTPASELEKHRIQVAFVKMWPLFIVSICAYQALLKRTLVASVSLTSRINDNKTRREQDAQQWGINNPWRYQRLRKPWNTWVHFITSCPRIHERGGALGPGAEGLCG